jgi:DNA-binding beta-propeller fold protein YncE
MYNVVHPALSHVIAAAKPKEPTMTHIIPGDRRVIGVTSLGDRLFVLRSQSDRQIEVYNSTTFTFQQTIRVNCSKEGYWFDGLTSSGAENCLLVSDYGRSAIYRIDLTSGNQMSQWPVVGGPRGISINAANNVLVACCTDNEIREYTTNGKLVREIKLSQSDVSLPTHSIQLTDDQFLLSHLEPVEGVSVIDSTGKVLRSYRNDQSTNRHFNEPRQLVVARNGCVLVADKHNSRIVILNSSLSCARDLSVSVDGRLQGPRCLFLDESRGRLIIGEYRGNRVLVFDNITVD